MISQARIDWLEKVVAEYKIAAYCFCDEYELIHQNNEPDEDEIDMVVYKLLDDLTAVSDILAEEPTE